MGNPCLTDEKGPNKHFKRESSEGRVGDNLFKRY